MLFISTRRIKSAIRLVFLFLLSFPTLTGLVLPDEQKKEDKDKKKKKDSEGPAYWPLIRQVKVYVKADALSTGAVLCDLPGCADANAARSNIAKDYMKRANCIWVLAPIHRAVDDKTAKGKRTKILSTLELTSVSL